MTIFQKWFGSSRNQIGDLERAGFMFSKENASYMIPLEMIARELSEIKRGVSGIQSDVADVRADVSALSQDVKGLGSTQSRHETWLTKIDGDVIALRGFPQKIEAVEKTVMKLESDVSALKAFQTSETAIDASKRAGLSKTQSLLVILSIVIGFVTNIFLALLWLIPKLPL